MRLLILLCFSVLANAAAITSAQTGAWDNTSTWVGGVIPSNGDTVVLANGHTVTINSGTTVTVGSSPADNTGTAAVACSSGTGTGVLVVSGTLIFRGPVNQCASTWTISPGATITHDSSQGTPTPSAINYVWRFTGANTQTSAFLYAVGNQANRITFNVAASSGNAGGFTTYNGSGTDGSVFVEYADISYWGVTGGSGTLYKGYPFTCSTSVVRGVAFRNVTIDNSGEISVGPSFGSCTFDLYNVVITNPNSAMAVGLGVGNLLNTAIATNGRRRIQNVFVDGASVVIATHASNIWDLGLQISGNYLRSPNSASTYNAFTCNGRCVVGASGSSDLNWYESRDTASTAGNRPPGGSISRLMLIMSDTADGHNATLNPEATTVDGLIAWNSVDGNSGDDNLFVSGTGFGSHAVVVKNAVALKRPSGGDIGTMLNITGAACTGTNCTQITLDKSTWFVGDFTGTSYLSVTIEGSNGYAGIVDSVRDNLVHRTASGIGQIIKWSSSLSVPAGVFELADYNWSHNVTSSPKYYSEAGANAEYAATPGSNDQSGDPLFVDVTRTPLTYAARWDSSVTTLDLLAAKYKACYQYRANGTTSCDPRFYDLADMYNWVRAGWRTRNPATWTAAHDGSHVGGVAPMKTFGVLAQ